MTGIQPDPTHAHPVLLTVELLGRIFDLVSGCCFEKLGGLPRHLDGPGFVVEGDEVVFCHWHDEGRVDVVVPGRREDVLEHLVPGSRVQEGAAVFPVEVSAEFVEERFAVGKNRSTNVCMIE